MIRCALSFIGALALGVVAVILYYEGVRLPIIGQVFPGEIDARLKSYVELVEKTATDSAAKEAQRQQDAAAQAIEEYRKRALAADQAKDQAHAELEQRIAQDADGGCGWSAADDLWLRHH